MYVIFLMGRFGHILINTIMQSHLLLCTSKLIITNVSNLLHMHHGLNFSQFVEQGQLVQMIGQHSIEHRTSQKYVFSEGGSHKSVRKRARGREAPDRKVCNAR